LEINNISAWQQSMDLEKIEENIFRGQNHDMGSPNVFGGQALSQALHAAILTVPKDRIAHSLHSYFILPGDLSIPIIYQVSHIRDGGSFTTRRVTAIQKGKAIFIMAASFQLQQEGLEHHMDMPEVTPPEELQSDQDLLKQFAEHLPNSFKRFLRPRPIEMRPVNPMSFIARQAQEPTRYVWMKVIGDMPDDTSVHQRLLAYASDYNLLTTAIKPHQDKVSATDLQLASLDHAMWFHRNCQCKDWMLFAFDSPSASNARGFTRGSIYNRSGELVASMVQEGLMRIKKKST